MREVRDDISHEIEKIRRECFDSDVAHFIRELRNNLLHGSVVIPKWEIRYNHQNHDNSSAMKYTVRELMRFGRWKESREYLSNVINRMISLSEVVGEHFKLIRDLDRKMQDLLDRNVCQAERDYYDIEDSHKRNLRRQWAKILLSQIGKGKDPYEYLHRFFNPDTIREILRYPQRSKEQVDFIVTLKTTELDCDDELRRMLYQKFGVVDDSSH